MSTQDKLSLVVKGLKERIQILESRRIGNLDSRNLNISISYYSINWAKERIYDRFLIPSENRYKTVASFIGFTFLLFSVGNIYPSCFLILFIFLNIISLLYIFPMSCKRKMMDRPSKISEIKYFTIQIIMKPLEFFINCIISLFFVSFINYYAAYQLIQSSFFAEIYDLLPNTLIEAINHYDSTFDCSHILLLILFLALYIRFLFWNIRLIEESFIRYYKKDYEWKNFHIKFIDFLAIAVPFLTSSFVLNGIITIKDKPIIFLCATFDMFFYLIVFSKYISDKKLIEQEKIATHN